MKRTYIFFTLVIILLFLTYLVLPEIAVGQPPPPPPGKPTQTPIDGGLALLAAAGGAYAINKLARRNLLNEGGVGGRKE